MVEQHLISPELSQADDGAGLVLSKDRSCCVMINEEDHLRIQVLRNGLDFGSVWKKANALDVGIESNLDYAYDGDLGFLTACPTNLGTGLRASVMMHLPGLVMSKNMDKVVNAVNQLGDRGSWNIWGRIRCQWKRLSNFKPADLGRVGRRYP